MKIYNLIKCSFIDYPGTIAAVVFLRGCNFRCGYCHNAHIIPLEGETHITEDEVIAFLNKRKKVLQGVVVTGGEPTVQDKELISFLEKLRAIETYKIKLDTNGYRPDLLKKILDAKLVDYVAMDIKANKEKYKKIIQVPCNMDKIQKSIDLIKASGLPHQFRTTYDKRILTDTDIKKIMSWIADPDNYIVQECILRDNNGRPR